MRDGAIILVPKPDPVSKEVIMTKIIVATRTSKDQYDNCIEKLSDIDCEEVSCFYIVCNVRKRNQKINKKTIVTIFDPNPTRPTSFNLVLDKIRRRNKQEHLFTFSKEVEVKAEHIQSLFKELNENVIVMGYELSDNILSNQEQALYSNGAQQETGIAYWVPWNTCALWNMYYLTGKNRLWFDEICEKENNQLGPLVININGRLIVTDYEGMEDGLAIARLLTLYNNNNLKFRRLKYKGQSLNWNLPDDDNNKLKQKKKMARKNIVLSTFMGIRGYSIEQLRNARQ